MSDYTPTTDEVRYAYVDYYYPPGGRSHAEGLREVDRWLAARDREVAARTLREVAEDAYAWDSNPDPDGVGGNDWFPSDWAGQVQGWLHHRADLLKGDSGEWIERGEDV